MALIVTTNHSTDTHERGINAYLCERNGRVLLDISDSNGKTIAQYRDWNSWYIDNEEASTDEEADEDTEDDRNVMYVDVLPDMTKFREAFGLGVEGLGFIVQPGDRIGCPGHTGRINGKHLFYGTPLL